MAGTRRAASTWSRSTCAPGPTARVRRRPATVYLSIDLDALDPAFAPGVSHREPGGLTVREVLTLIDTLGGELIGADIVELNPSQDVGGLTAGVAAKLVKELAAKFVVESD